MSQEDTPTSDQSQSRVRSSVRLKEDQVAPAAEQQLADPADTIAVVRTLLETPDEQGRMIPSLDVFLRREGQDEGGQFIKKDYVDPNPPHHRLGHSRVDFDQSIQQAYLTKIGAQAGQGYGRRIYLEAVVDALELGFDLRSDPIHSTGDAVGMWQWLKTQGLATKVDDFVLDPDSPIGAHTGYYVVNGNNKPKVSEVM